MDLSFWEVYFPVFAALLSSAVLMEGIHLVIFLIQRHKDKKKLQEVKNALAEQYPELGNLDDSQIYSMMQGQPLPMSFTAPAGSPETTTSGISDHAGGQYV